MKTYEYPKYMRDGTVRIITAVVRSRNENKKSKKVKESGDV